MEYEKRIGAELGKGSAQEETRVLAAALLVTVIWKYLALRSYRDLFKNSHAFSSPVPSNGYGCMFPTLLLCTFPKCSQVNTNQRGRGDSGKTDETDDGQGR